MSHAVLEGNGVDKGKAEDQLIGPEEPALASATSYAQGDGASADPESGARRETNSADAPRKPLPLQPLPGSDEELGAPAQRATPAGPAAPSESAAPGIGANFLQGGGGEAVELPSSGGGLVARNIPPRVSSISPLAAMGRAPGAMDLQQCFRLAAIRSDTLKISFEDIAAAKARTSQTIAALYPTIRFNSNHNFFDTSGQNSGNNSAFTFDPSSAGATGQATTVDSSSLGISSTQANDYVMNTTLSMSLPIFNGLKNINDIYAARAGTESSQQSLRRSYQTLYGDVAEAFYQILSSEGVILVLRDQVSALEARVRELQDRVQLGRSRPSELLQARADLASTKVSIEQAKGTLAAARELMAFYIGVPSNSFALRESQKFPHSRTLESYLRTVGARPDILQRVASERQAKHQLSSAKGALWPTINLTSDITLVAEPESNQDWTVGLTISLPIFDGGLIISQIRERKALLRQSALNVRQVMRQADQEIRTSFVNFSASAAQVLQLREFVELSGLSFDAQAADYKLGIVSNLDVLNALRTFHDARRQYHDADMTGRLNLIKLHVAAGTTGTSMPEVESGNVRRGFGPADGPVEPGHYDVPVPADGSFQTFSGSTGAAHAPRAVPVAMPVTRAAGGDKPRAASEDTKLGKKTSASSGNAKAKSPKSSGEGKKKSAP